jgi:hypothetical protein
MAQPDDRRRILSTPPHPTTDLDPPPAAGDSRGGSDRVAEALALLTAELQERIRRHPLEHLFQGTREPITVTLELSGHPSPARGGGGDPAARLSVAMDAALDALLTHRAVVRPGAVLCLRCGGTDCEHARPRELRQVFAGYTATGVPRFEDFGQLLLELKDPAVEGLYQAPPRVAARVLPEAALTAELLPAYRKGRGDFRIHGQVVAGFFPLPDPAGRPHHLAITLQVVSTRGARRGRRYAANLLGVGPQGEPLEHLYDRLPAVPWAASLRWAQGILDGLGDGAGPRRRGSVPGPRPERRIGGLLAAIARRLERGHRAEERKTLHARERHARGDRPTPMALPDLRRATPQDILVDVRAATLVVLGERGRAHVFSPDGRLVTSVRTHPAAVERRLRRGQWRPAREHEAAALKGAVAGALEGSPGGGGSSPRGPALP